MESTKQNIFLTGVSSGIGHGLAEHYLNQGATVYGMSRRTPTEFSGHDRFHFLSVDLLDAGSIAAGVGQLLGEVADIDLAILNAGILGQFGDLADASLDDLQQTMQVNMWANKLLLDGLFASVGTVGQVVAISSGASVNGHRGWSGYSISKAALNMMIKTYAAEQSDTHFCAFAPGIVDTAMQDTLCGREPDEKYEAIEVLRSKRGTDEMPNAEEAASKLAAAMAALPGSVASGDYADLRKLDFQA